MNAQHNTDEGAAMRRWWAEYGDRLRRVASAQEKKTPARPGSSSQAGGRRPVVSPLCGCGAPKPLGRLVMLVLTGIRDAWSGGGHARAERRESEWYRF